MAADPGTVVRMASDQSFSYTAYSSVHD